MTNKEKAKELASAWSVDHAYNRARISAIQMAEWKDQQLKEYLENKQNEFLKHTREDFLGRHFDVCATLIGEIINELFKE